MGFLFDSKPFSNQCWFIFNLFVVSNMQWNFDKYTNWRKWSGDGVCKMSMISFRWQCVLSYIDGTDRRVLYMVLCFHIEIFSIVFIHWVRRVIVLSVLPSLATLEVVSMKTFGAAWNGCLYVYRNGCLKNLTALYHISLGCLLHINVLKAFACCSLRRLWRLCSERSISLLAPVLTMSST